MTVFVDTQHVPHRRRQPHIERPMAAALWCLSLTDRPGGSFHSHAPLGWIGQRGQNRGFWDQQVRAGVAPAAARTGTLPPWC